MKVVIAHNRYVSTQPSGENTVVDTESRLLTEAGVEVVDFQRSSDEIPTLPRGEKLLLPISPMYARRAQRELTALLRAHRPDVLHLHNPYPLLSPWVIRTAHAHGVPVVQTVHNFRHVCVSGVYFRDGHECRDCLGRRFALPAIRHSCYRGSRAQSVIMATTLAAHRGTWRSVERFLPISPVIAEHLQAYGIPADRITVKPNAVPDPGRHDQTGEGFVYVGRLVPEKGVTLLLDAWRRYPDGALGTLRIIGDGPLRDLVATVAAERTDVTFLGQLPSEGVRAAMRESAAVVMPSTWNEPYGLVAVEALANARPVVVTRCGFLPYLVGDGKAGWVTEPTVEALADALGRAYKEAPTLTAAARERYETAFTPRVVIDQLIGIYREVSAAGVS